jgi:TM2 domain-containing membrane protein YozV
MKIEEYQRRRPDSLSHVNFLPLKIFCLNNAHRWDEARSCFQSYVALQEISPENKTRLVEAFNQLYLPKRLPKIKKENTAENLSRFIPGAGQIYAGETTEGIINLTLNASVLAFAGYQIYHHYYITGYLAGLGLFNKTYHGGMKRAGVLASQYNKRTIARFNSEVMQMIGQILQ